MARLRDTSLHKAALTHDHTDRPSVFPGAQDLRGAGALDRHGGEVLHRYRRYSAHRFNLLHSVRALRSHSPSAAMISAGGLVATLRFETKNLPSGR